jgi:hypothetical protein
MLNDIEFLEELWIGYMLNSHDIARLNSIKNKLAEALKTSHNTGSPKLPDQNSIGNALRDMRAGQGAFVTDIEWGALSFIYEFIVRQLRASA